MRCVTTWYRAQRATLDARRPRRARRRAALLALLLATGCARTAFAFVPDATFGSDGAVGLDLGAPAEARDVAVQAPGKVLVLGQQDDGLVLLRLDASGSLDPSFGVAGTTAVVGSEPGLFSGEGATLAVQANGRIVVAGSADPGTVLVARFLPDGAPDLAFGDRGATLLPVPPPPCVVDDCRHGGVAIAIDRAGRIVVAAPLGDATMASTTMAAIRLTADGAVDASFGRNGIATTPIGWSAHDIPSAVAVTSAGAVVLAGTRYDAFASASGGVLAWLAPSGAPDRSVDGGPVLALPGMAVIDMAVDALGRIVVTGPAVAPGASHTDVAVARWLPSGQLDRSFGARGVAFANVTSETSAVATGGRSLAITASGRIVVAALAVGSPGNPCLQLPSVALGGLGPAGTPEPTGSALSFAGGVAGLALQPDGKLLIASTTSSLCRSPFFSRIDVHRVLPPAASEAPGSHTIRSGEAPAPPDVEPVELRTGRS